MTARVIPLRRPEAGVAALSDEALLAACALADSAALGALFDRHHLRVHRFLARLAGVGPVEVEDLLQETFASVWSSARRYQGRSPALTWIFGIAANIARNHARSRQRGARAMFALSELPSTPPERSDDIAARKESLRRIEAALSAIPHDLRVAFVLCDLEGISGVDAAKTLDVRPGTIWRRLHEARTLLRRALEEVVP
ncbi:MAG: RNA polymerase sigma factor [Deltaproteobacteria bacterium]|nr:RNA polymerase sigma factor [Deltaproteobacteria bacterium]